MIGHGGHVGRHYARRVDERHRVLHANALEGVRIVARPYLVEPSERTEIHAAGAGRAALHHRLRVLLPDAAHNVVEPLGVLDEEAVRRLPEVRAAERDHHAVEVPLYVVDVGRALHHAVKDAEDEVLHRRVAEVQVPLVARFVQLAPGALDHPVGVLLRKLGGGIDHLRLYPDAEFESLGVGVRGQVAYALGQLGGVDLPVAKGCVVGVARVFVAEPAVVEHEHLEPHRRGVVNHPEYGLRVEGEVCPLPAVEEDGAEPAAAIDAVLARPAVHVAGNAARALAGTCPNHVGGAERCARGKRILGGEGVDAAGYGKPVFDVVIEIDGPVAAPRKRSSHCLAAVFVEHGAVHAQHERGIGALGGLHAGAAAEGLDAVPQHLGLELPLLGPCAADVRKQVAARPQAHRARCAIDYAQRLLAAVYDLGVRDNHILGLVRLVVQGNDDVRDVIL